MCVCVREREREIFYCFFYFSFRNEPGRMNYKKNYNQTLSRIQKHQICPEVIKPLIFTKKSATYNN